MAKSNILVSLFVIQVIRLVTFYIRSKLVFDGPIKLLETANKNGYKLFEFIHMLRKGRDWKIGNKVKERLPVLPDRSYY